MSSPCENCGADLRVCKDCIIHDGYVPWSVINDIKAEIEDEIDKEFDLCVRHSGRDVLRLTCLKEFRSLIDRKVNEVKGDKECFLRGEA